MKYLHVGDNRGISRLVLVVVILLVAGAAIIVYPFLFPASLAGTIEIDGSSTVFPITEAVANAFNDDHPDVRVPVGISGSGGGFRRFVRGETDISDASRPIKDSEIELAEENGIEFIEFKIGIDGLSVMVHPDNDFVECLTMDELNHIWRPENPAQTWQDVRSEWPNDPIRLYGPGTDSGTFDYFTEEVNGEAGASRPDYTASEDDNVLVQGIAGDPLSLGYFGYAYYVENEGELKLLGVDDGDGCVQPNDETIPSGEYPLARPLFIYVNTESLQRSEVREFVEFYLMNAKEFAEQVGYTTQPQSVLDENLRKLGLEP